MSGNNFIGIQIINASATTNNSKINLSGEHDIGVSVYNTGKALIDNGSPIISKTLIDARKAMENYKNHPTDITLNVSGDSVVEGAVKTEEGATSNH